MRARPQSLFLILLTAACEAAPADELETIYAAVVYGADDRQQVYESVAPELRALAEHADVALVAADAVSEVSGTLKLRTESARDVWGLCDGERFADEPSVADCSGVLVAPDVVLTAGHCLRARACEDWAILRGFFYEAPDRLHPLRSDALAYCAEVLALEHGATSELPGDYAFIRLDRSLPAGSLPEKWLEPRPITRGSPLLVIGHSLGVPAKLDVGAAVVDPRSDEHDYFTADADNYAGGSGAGVFEPAGHLLGIAVSGATDFTPSPSGCVVSRRLPSGAGAERIVRFESALRSLCAQRRAPQSLCARPDQASKHSCSVRPGVSNPVQSTYLVLLAAALCIRRHKSS